jgi:hypothetical protein
MATHLDTLLQHFLRERKYLRNVSPETIEWYQCAWKAFRSARTHKPGEPHAHAGLLLPHLRGQRQFVQLRPGLAPCWVVSAKQCQESLAMGGFDQVKHLVDDDVLEQILGLLHELGVQAYATQFVARASRRRSRRRSSSPRDRLSSSSRSVTHVRVVQGAPSAFSRSGSRRASADSGPCPAVVRDEGGQGAPSFPPRSDNFESRPSAAAVGATGCQPTHALVLR